MSDDFLDLDAEMADDDAVSAVLRLMARRRDAADRLDAVARRLVNLASHLRTEAQ